MLNTHRSTQQRWTVEGLNHRSTQQRWTVEGLNHRSTQQRWTIEGLNHRSTKQRWTVEGLFVNWKEGKRKNVESDCAQEVSNRLSKKIVQRMGANKTVNNIRQRPSTVLRKWWITMMRQPPVIKKGHPNTRFDHHQRMNWG